MVHYDIQPEGGDDVCEDVAGGLEKVLLLDWDDVEVRLDDVATVLSPFFSVFVPNFSELSFSNNAS